MRADFDLDAIADLKIAVDEACSMLIMRAAKGSTLQCTFGTDEAGISVVAEVDRDGGEPLDENVFGWHVLSTLTDEVSWHSLDGDSPARLKLQLSVRRKAIHS